MPIATATRASSRRPRRARKVNPTKTVKGWELNNLRKQVKRMIPKPEKKIEDKTQALTIVTSTATITSLFDPANGAASDQRIGDEVTARSMFVRLSVTPNVVSGMNFVRIIIVRDRQGNGVAPTAAQILEVPGNHLSPLNDDFGMRFKVLFDRTYTVDTDATGSQVDKIYRRLNFKVEWEDNAVIPNANGIYMLQISDQAVNGPSVAWYNRVRFTDV